MKPDLVQFETRQPHPYDTNPNWQTEGACHGKDTNLWFPRRGESINKIAEAKNICHNCPIQQKCLDYALWHHEQHGIWGGLTEFERRKLRTNLGIRPGPSNRTAIARLKQPVNNDMCGTYAGWGRHMRAHERPCEPCREAKNANQRDYIRKRRNRTT
jgi:hypothetical protein